LLNRIISNNDGKFAGTLCNTLESELIKFLRHACW
jgi:hypothetical protein